LRWYFRPDRQCGEDPTRDRAAPHSGRKRQEPGEWIVSIADNERGFDPEYAQQVFLPFKRLHGPETPGSGIGLATCKRIIDRLGGRIWRFISRCPIN
jgi:signal transduction histidine kinase